MEKEKEENNEQTLTQKEKNISQSNGTIHGSGNGGYGVYPVPAFAEEGQNVAQKVQVLDKTGGNIHDYGKTGMIQATPDVDESAIVANSDVLRSAQYQESTKYELKVNGTPGTFNSYFVDS